MNILVYLFQLLGIGKDFLNLNHMQFEQAEATCHTRKLIEILEADNSRALMYASEVN